MPLHGHDLISIYMVSDIKNCIATTGKRDKWE